MSMLAMMRQQAEWFGDRVDWDGRDEAGNDLAPGLYYFSIGAEGFKPVNTIIKL